MVLRSFFRNKVTKIYLTIITILLIAISFLFASVSYLNKLCDEEYQKGSIVYVESKEDIYDELMNNEDIVNPYEIIKFDYTDEEIINKYNIFEYEVDEKILVYADKDNRYNLKDDEVVINYFDNNLSNQDKERYEYFKNQNINFIFNGNNITFKIKKIEFKNHGSIVISNNLFNKLKKENMKYSYIVSFVSESVFKNHKDIGVKGIDLASVDDLAYSDKIKKNMNYIKYASYVCIGIFIIVIIVVNKNIISDLKNNMSVEVKLGYTNTQVRLNILKRLFLLHLLSLILAVLISAIVILIIKNIFTLNMSFNFIYKDILLICLIIMSDILLSLILKVKK